MDEYLFSGEIVIKKKGANFLLSLDEHGLPKFGLLGLDSEMRLFSLPEGNESIGGWINLTNFRLFFWSHRFNRFKGTFSIFLPNIIAVKDVSQPLTLSRIMKLTTKNCDFKFTVWKISAFIAEINAAQNSISPEQIEELKKAVRNSSEKCGDGFNVNPPVMDLF